MANEANQTVILKAAITSNHLLTSVFNPDMTTHTTETYTKINPAFSSYHIGLLVFAVLVLLTNVFAISLYCRHASIRKHLSNILLVSLALSDLLISFGYIPLLVIIERTSFENNKWLYTLSRYHWMLGNLCGFSTVFHIIALTLDKYIAVLYPFKKINLSTPWFYKKILLSLWIAALSFAIIPLFWIFENYESADWFRKLHIYGIFQLVIFFGVSILILLYCYSRMFVRIHQQKYETSLTGRVQLRERTDRKTILTFLCFFVVFVIGWFPWFLFTLDNKMLHIPVPIKDFLVTLRYLGTFLNPLIYGFLKNDYRQAIKSDLLKLCSGSPTMVNLLHLNTANHNASAYKYHGKSCDEIASLTMNGNSLRVRETSI